MASTISRQPSDTVAFGKDLATRLKAGSIVALTGDLGAGKTQFAKGVLAGLNYQGEVTSPTFTLIHEYFGGRLPVFHFDFYRLTNIEEAIQIGIEDYLGGDGVCLIEWADKFPELLPEGTRWYELRIASDDSRSIDQRL